MTQYASEFDIIGGLPAELVAQVSEYLDIRTLVRIHRVSKRWKYLLHHKLLRVKLSDWVDIHDPPLEDERTASSESDICCLKAEHVDAYKRGIPFHSALFTKTGLIHPCLNDFLGKWCLDLPRVDLHGDNLAWVREAAGADFLECLNLRTGHRQTISIEDHQSISCVAVTSDLFVHVTQNGVCYARHIVTNQARYISLPSVYIQALSGRRSNVVIICGTSKIGYHGILWDFDRDNSTSFALQDYHQLLPDEDTPSYATRTIFGAIVDTSGLSVVVFEEDSKTLPGRNRDLALCFTKYSAHGTILASGKHVFDADEVDKKIGSLVNIRPCNNNGLFSIAFANNADSSRKRNVLFFDETTASLSRCVFTDSGYLTGQPWYLWKDIVLIGKAPQPLNQVRIKHMRKSKNEANSRSLVYENLLPISNEPYVAGVLVNETFAVFVEKTRPLGVDQSWSLRVYSFDKGVDFSKADGVRHNVNVPAGCSWYDLSAPRFPANVKE